jgi:dienelactone hydrolase
VRGNHPNRRPVDREGLVGELFLPATPPQGLLPAVLLLHGSEGGEGRLHNQGARGLVEEGYAVLTLPYFGAERLPQGLREIPLEYFEEGLRWLQAQPEVDAERIGVVGRSKGGELALLLGATYPEAVKAVVGYAPSGVAWQSIPAGPADVRGGPRSSWTLGAEPVPFVPFDPSPSVMAAVEGFFSGRPTSLTILHESALENEAAVERAEIAVEGIKGPLLLISGTDDRLWPSSRLSEIAVERLRRHEHPFPYEHLRYEGAGHQIGAPGPDETQFVREFGPFVLGGSKETNLQASVDSWPRVLDTLSRGLGGSVA